MSEMVQNKAMVTAKH